jgi:hypothetical protein
VSGYSCFFKVRGGEILSFSLFLCTHSLGIQVCVYWITKGSWEGSLKKGVIMILTSSLGPHTCLDPQSWYSEKENRRMLENEKKFAMRFFWQTLKELCWSSVTHTHIQTYTHTHINTHTHTYIHTYILTHTHTHTHTVSHRLHQSTLHTHTHWDVCGFCLRREWQEEFLKEFLGSVCLTHDKKHSRNVRDKKQKKKVDLHQTCVV